MMDLQLKGKTALVTGSTSGIGKVQQWTITEWQHFLKISLFISSTFSFVAEG
ncbi:hypothetical protein V529_33480 [Bacillus velezensis SQR9]|nr:hypothetical protein V529_33480 [Bacillus velezensis SQR9]